MKLVINEDFSNFTNSNSDYSSDENSNFSTNTLLNSIPNHESSVSVIGPTSNFITLDGVHSGIPTLTTPTLTPTTLKNIEQTFMELQSEAASHQSEAGFVPPSINSLADNSREYKSILESELHCSRSNSTWSSSADSKMSLSPPPPSSSSNASILNENNINNSIVKSKRKSTGGRKPMKNNNFSPEEEERRMLRRERNKMAAARCRKRRVDHTNSLISETESLEQRNAELMNEIQQLEQERDELEQLLNAHKISCRLRLVYGGNKLQNNNLVENNKREIDNTKNFIDCNEENFLTESAINKKVMLSSVATLPNKPNRPTSLNVPNNFVHFPNQLKLCNNSNQSNNLNSGSNEINGNNNNNSSAIDTNNSISEQTTPSIQFNFDSLIEGSTGLTPITNIAHFIQHRDSPTTTPSIDNNDSAATKLVSL